MNRRSSDRMDSDRDRLVHKDRVFVGKIPKGTTEHELRAVFENIGLKVSHISIQPSPRDMDFGFVTFNDERSVSKALEMANTSSLTVRGSVLAVHEAYTRANKRSPKPQYNPRGPPPSRNHQEGSVSRSGSPHVLQGNTHSPVSSPPIPPPHGNNRNAGASPTHNDNHMPRVYTMNEFMYTTYQMGALLANGQVVAIQQPQYTYYVAGSEYPTHQGQIPYCGSRGRGEILLPANPGIDASDVEPLSKSLQIMVGPNITPYHGIPYVQTSMALESPFAHAPFLNSHGPLPC